MPRRSKGPRLWLRPARRNAKGIVSHPAQYSILDHGVQRGTGFGAEQARDAEKALAAYLASKYELKATSEKRDPSVIPIRDVLTLYLNDVVTAPIKAIEQREKKDIEDLDITRPDIKAALNLETRAGLRIKRLNAFFGSKMLSEVNGALCRAYEKESSTDAMARRDLEDLRAAINHHRKEGLHDRIISVVLPERRLPRERYLERSEAAKLLWAAWRGGKKQVARFILIALYTGRRSSVVCGASFKREPGRSWIDTKSGYLYPPERVRKTKKRNPPIPLPEFLLTHMRAWERKGLRYPVPLTSGGMGRSVKRLAAKIGLAHVTPHVMRHTAATWMMQEGVDLWQASGYLGMTIQTLETVYGHHRPQHLTDAKTSAAPANVPHENLFPHIERPSKNGNYSGESPDVIDRRNCPNKSGKSNHIRSLHKVYPSLLPPFDRRFAFRV
jgi:integrase